MAGAIDYHIGKRLRRRRRLLGLTQAELAEVVGIRFQQIQKYESGTNRVTGARLYELAIALNVPVTYFYEGLENTVREEKPANDRGNLPSDVLSQRETLELIRAYYDLSSSARKRLLSLAKALASESEETG